MPRAASTDAPDEPKKKPHRWRKRLLWLTIIVLILAPLVNGPIFRKVARWQIDKVLHNLYLDGDYELSGSILGGLQLDEVDLRGSRNLRSLTIAHAEVDYRIAPLLRGKWGEGVKKIHVRGIDVQIDNSATFPTDPEIESRKEEKRAKKEAKNKPQKLWSNLNALFEQDLAVTDLNLKSKQPRALGIDDFSFEIKGGGGSIRAKQITYPNGEVSESLDAKLTSRGDPILEIINLDIADGIAIDRLTATTPPPGRVPLLSGKLELLGGEIDINVVGQTGWTATLSSGAIELARASDLLQKDFGITGRITELGATIDPAAANLVEAGFATESLAYKSYSTDTLDAEIAYRSDRIELRSLRTTSGKNGLTGNAAYSPAAKLVEATGQIAAPDLKGLSANLGIPEIGGALGGSINFRLEDGDFTDSSTDLTATGLSYAGNRIQKAKLNAEAKPNNLIGFNLDADIDGKQTNTVKARGQFATDSKALDTDLTIEIADLGSLAEASAEVPPLGGSLSAVAKLGLRDGKMTDSKADIRARSLSYGGANIGAATIHAETSSPNAFDFKIDSAIDSANQVTASGNYNLDTQRYQADAKIDLAELAKLHPTFAALDVKPRPTGKVDLTWNGEGSLREKQHRGSAKIPAFTIKPDTDQTTVAGKLNLEYTPDSFSLSDFSARSAELSIAGAAQLKDKRLDVDSLRLFNDTTAIARADISIPFDTKTLGDLGDFFDQPGKLSIKIDSDKLKLADLIAMTGKPASIAATIDAAVDLSGTLADPKGTGNLDVLQLRNPKNSDLSPADARLNFTLGGKQLKLDGVFEHPEIQPITVRGHTPLIFEKLSKFSSQKIDLAISLPETKLEIAEKHIPDLITASGTASADVRVTGTIEKPDLNGNLRIVSPLLKFKQHRIPTITDLNVNLKLEGDRLQISSFRSYIAGGEVKLDGKADFPTLTNPQLDLTLTARQALIIRDDSLSLRANADLTLRGPFEKAALAGKIGITQSRFFREIEILPIGLPKSSPTPAAPRAPSFGTKKEIGLAAVPFRDWPVDVKIVTDDPFLVRSNLARADIVSDLHIAGTLGKPVPNGKITLGQGRATLPFSELETTQGVMTFSEKTGFDPEVDFRATSKVHDYNINLIAYGKMSDPKTLITSDPPLPESEAITLLATGAKSSKLSDGEAIAGNAALLLIDKLRRKYAKGTPIERRQDSLRELLSFKAGQIDPRTGKRAASASLGITDNVYLLGNVDVEGEYRGLVKFIFRFK